MPAIYPSISNLPSEISIACWDFQSEDLSFFVSETHDLLCNAILDKGQIAQKQKESLAGRFLLQQKLLQENHPISTIQIHEDGKPYLPQGPHFSISHTQKFAAVAVSKSLEVGIDLEENHRKVAKIAPRFLSKSELEFFASEKDQLLAWCMKEAIYKAHGKKGIDFRFDMQIENRANSYVGIIRKKEEKKEFALYWSIEEHFTICLAHLIL